MALKNSIYDYDDYRQYLVAILKERSETHRGEKSRIARLLKVHPSYITLVLSGKADLSFEQAFTLNSFLNHPESEAEYFMLLVSHARAGTPELRAFQKKKIHALLEKQRILKDRLEFQKTIPVEYENTYFSSWQYTAVHLLLMIPEFQTKEGIKRRLGLSFRQINTVLEFLVQAGFAVQKGERFQVGPVSIHLGVGSPNIKKSHTNWRMQAIEALDRDLPHQLHYSSAVTMSRADAPKVREILTRAIEQVRAVVKTSPEEELFCYAVDFFRAGPEG